MDKYLLPYLLLMAHFVSGGLWLIRINRKLDRSAAREQWIKIGVYLLIVNLVWFSLLWNEIAFRLLGILIIAGSTLEGWKVARTQKGRIGFILPWLLVVAGFTGFLFLDKNILFFTFFVVVLFDGSCQIAGQLLGKTPLVPKISPRKTVEGLAGGTAITLGTTMLVYRSFSFTWTELFLLTTLLMLTAFFGDLLASIIKRKAGLATFGRILPGHGGLLDRFDSLLLSGAGIFLLSLIQLDRMNSNFKYYLLYAIAYGIILLLGELMYRLLRSGPEWSRNFSHLAAGLISLPFPWLFSSHWWVLLLAVQSSAILWATRYKGMLPSHHRAAGKSLGSFLFFASIYLCFMAAFTSGRKELYVIPMLVLSFGDVAAAMTGRYMLGRSGQVWRWRRNGYKTVPGSMAFFIIALAVLFLSYSPATTGLFRGREPLHAH